MYVECRLEGRHAGLNDINIYAQVYYVNTVECTLDKPVGSPHHTGLPLLHVVATTDNQVTFIIAT